MSDQDEGLDWERVHAAADEIRNIINRVNKTGDSKFRRERIPGLTDAEFARANRMVALEYVMGSEPGFGEGKWGIEVDPEIEAEFRKLDEPGS